MDLINLISQLSLSDTYRLISPWGNHFTNSHGRTTRRLDRTYVSPDIAAVVRSVRFLAAPTTTAGRALSTHESVITTIDLAQIHTGPGYYKLAIE
ncbi:hypothetical protein V1514DRAFT_323023 [Lipomyces japonicus]|uniref:uncharacterized protein n=1 Tax=Lipomyces japonicus TaxID=56871 RepID=UPI0034CE2398